MGKIPVLAAFLAAVLFLSPMESGAASLVIDGKDGWYFYADDSTLADYAGTDLFTIPELLTIRQNCLATRDALAAQGMEFVIFLAPNKEHVYSEYMPDWVGQQAALNRLEQLTAWLGMDGTLRVVCPLASLQAAKAAFPEYDFYYRTDTHWNPLGAYTASRDLLRELGITTPGIRQITVTKIQGPGLELARSSGRDLLETSFEVFGTASHTPSVQSDYATYYRSHNSGTDPRKLVLYGDSFGLGLCTTLSGYFDDVYASYRTVFDPYLIAREQPDVVVFECLERFLDVMLTAPLIP